MIKIIDLDGLFDEYISDYVYKNIGKIKPEEIENQMPVLYNKFGDEKLKELDGKTPNEFYRSYSANELLDCLKRHLKEKVPVSDFLCEALRDCDTENEIAEELQKDNEEEYTLYLMNVLLEKKSDKAVPRYLEFVLFDYPSPVKELASEILQGYADRVKEDILSQYNDCDKDTKELLVEILSHAKKDDRIFEILLNGFLYNQDKIPLYAGYLGKYGDDRALPYLKTVAESDKISYADFEEVRFAIEMLGGECNAKRDFSSDATYKKIKNGSKKRNGNDIIS